MRNLFILSLVAGACVSNAASITTLFAGGNNNSAGGGNYFQVNVGSNALTVTGFDVNTLLAQTGIGFGFEVYTCANTHLGNELLPGNWTLRASGSGVGAGANLPSSITLGGTFNLNANTNYGMAIFLRGTAGLASLSYTNGNGTNQAYSNADLSLALGTSTNGYFTPSVFNPRVWNGTIRYNVVPEPATMVALGLGAVAFIRRRRK